MHYRLNPSINY